MAFSRNHLSSIILASLGIVDSLYLTWIKLTENPALCIKGLGDCISVNNSKYSELFGIPVSVLGALTYGVILLILFLKSKQQFFTENGDYILFGISFFGAIYSIYLTYLEVAVIRAICPFCIISAVTIFAIFILSIKRLVLAR
jgi:uncharacterized membrane protein